MSLFIQAARALWKELLAHLRGRRIIRLGQTSISADQTRGQIFDAVSIRNSPAEIADRATPGHGDGILPSDATNSQIAALVDRNVRFVMLVKVGGKDYAVVHLLCYISRGQRNST